MRAIVAAMLASAVGCAKRAPSLPPHGAKPPAFVPEVDVARLRAAIEGSWVTSVINGDTITVTRTLALRAGEVVATETTVQIDGTTNTTTRGGARYTVSPTGTLAIVEPFAATEQRFTPIVFDATTCAAHAARLGAPRSCRALGWHGYLAQSRDGRRYRREWSWESRGDRGAHHLERYNVDVRFEPPLAQLVRGGGACRAELDVTAEASTGGRTPPPAARHLSLACTVTPPADGDGRATLALADYDVAAVRAGEHDADVRRLLERAILPVVELDPDDPSMLYGDGLGDAYFEAR